MNKGRGFTLIEMALTILASIIILLVTVPPMQRSLQKIKGTTTLESYVYDVFDGMELYYHSQINLNGGCYNIAPPPLTAELLVNEGFLDLGVIDESFFNARNASLTYLPRHAGGRIDEMRIEVIVTESSSDKSIYQMVPFWSELSGNTIIFSKNIKFSTDEFVLNNTDTSYCKGS